MDKPIEKRGDRLVLNAYTHEQNEKDFAGTQLSHNPSFPFIVTGIQSKNRKVLNT
eukprot:IDg14877t1